MDGSKLRVCHYLPILLNGISCGRNQRRYVCSTQLHEFLSVVCTTYLLLSDVRRQGVVEFGDLFARLKGWIERQAVIVQSFHGPSHLTYLIHELGGGDGRPTTLDHYERCVHPL